MLYFELANSECFNGTCTCKRSFSRWTFCHILIYLFSLRFISSSLKYFIQLCFVCRPLDSTVWEDALIDRSTVATFALAHWQSGALTTRYTDLIHNGQDFTHSRLPAGLRIRIRVRIRIGSGFNRVSGSRRAKMTHKSKKKLKVHVLKCWVASFESWRLLL